MVNTYIQTARRANRQQYHSKRAASLARAAGGDCAAERSDEEVSGANINIVFWSTNNNLNTLTYYLIITYFSSIEGLGVDVSSIFTRTISVFMCPEPHTPDS